MEISVILEIIFSFLKQFLIITFLELKLNLIFIICIQRRSWLTISMCLDRIMVLIFLSPQLISCDCFLIFQDLQETSTMNWIKSVIAAKFWKLVIQCKVCLKQFIGLLRLFYSLLDCCNVKNDGNNEYKGNCTFPKALAGSKISQTCKYGGISGLSSNAVVNCEPNMETGPVYALLNVTLCSGKHQTTNDLEKLNQGKIILVSYHKKR